MDKGLPSSLKKIGNCLRDLEERHDPVRGNPENLQDVVNDGINSLITIIRMFNGSKNGRRKVFSGVLVHMADKINSSRTDLPDEELLENLILECRYSTDAATAQKCASALLNFSLRGSASEQECMVGKDLHQWLLPLALHEDEPIKYSACLAISVLASQRKIEKEVAKSNLLHVVKQFLLSHDPNNFSLPIAFQNPGISEKLLRKLLPLLKSPKEEVCTFATFHFCTDASARKAQGSTEIFKEIGAIEPLTLIASSPFPSDLAPRFAAQALEVIGKPVPPGLSPEVSHWSREDVRQWVTLKEFEEYADSFMRSKVNGDLLLELTEDMLKDEIGVNSKIDRKRFMGDLERLKLSLSSVISEYPEDILHAFISYRRANGSKFASLLRVHLQRQDLNAFIDVRGLEGGRFDTSLLRHIQRTRAFILVLTPGALDRCIGDWSCKDWVHREIAEAIKAKRKIIPVVEKGFEWPEDGKLPADIQDFPKHNAIIWSDEHEDSCVQKLVRFIRGDDADGF